MYVTPATVPGIQRFMTGLTELAKEAKGCQRCDLYRNATQTVFGDGACAASLMLVGQQPGDQEDKAGKPFVGPAPSAGQGTEPHRGCRPSALADC